MGKKGREDIRMMDRLVLGSVLEADKYDMVVGFERKKRGRKSRGAERYEDRW